MEFIIILIVFVFGIIIVSVMSSINMNINMLNRNIEKIASNLRTEKTNTSTTPSIDSLKVQAKEFEPNITQQHTKSSQETVKTACFTSQASPKVASTKNEVINNNIEIDLSQTESQLDIEAIEKFKELKFPSYVHFEKGIGTHNHPETEKLPTAFETLSLRILNYVIYGKESKPENIEGAIATTWLIRIASLLILFLFGYIAQITQFDLFLGSGVGRSILSVLLGSTLLFFGIQKFKSQQNIFAQMLISTGVASFYFMAYTIVSTILKNDIYYGFSIFLVVIVFCTFLALKYASQSIAIVSIIGGYLTPLLIYYQYPCTTMYIIYNSLIVYSLLIYAIPKRMPLLNITTLILYLIATSPAIQVGDYWALIPLAIAAAVFIRLPLIALFRRHGHSCALDVVTLFLATISLTAYGLHIMSAHALNYTVPLFFVLLLGTDPLIQWKAKWKDVLLSTCSIIGAALSLALSILLYFCIEYSIPIWGLIGISFLFAGNKFKIRPFQYMSVFFIFIMFIGMIHCLDYYDFSKAISVYDWDVFRFSISALGIPLFLLGFYARLLPKANEFVKSFAIFLFTIAFIGSLIWSTHEVTRGLNLYSKALTPIAISVLWSLYACGCVLYGLFQKSTSFRIIGLGIFSIVTLKLLFYDLWNGADMIRLCALVMLILFFILCAWYYKKFGIQIKDKA